MVVTVAVCSSAAADTCSEPVATSPLTAATSSTPSTARWVDRAWSSAASLISWTPWFVSSTASTTASSDDDGLERRRRLANDAGPLVDPRVRLADGRDLRLDLGGGRLRFLREILDFVRDDREPLAGLARAGGLDGGSALDGSGIKPLCRDSQ